jgi:2-iminoacetate synthase
MQTKILKEKWIENRIDIKEREKYEKDEKDFINDEQIINLLNKFSNPDKNQVREIINKAKAINSLSAQEAAILCNVKDKELIEEMEYAASQIKKKVYDNRIVTFAPLYMSTKCINNCEYCGFRRENYVIKRGVLSLEEIAKETQVLAGEIGHKRIIAVYGEHPQSDVDYIIKTMKTIYEIKVKTKNGYGSIRRINVNAAPMKIDELRKLHDAGLGTYQVFQETYHHETYKKLHPSKTIKGDYKWRVYCMHRAMDAGIDDVGIGVLFGLYDWKFEVVALVCHALELEKRFGIGPHTVSFPRIEPAINTPFTNNLKWKVSDEDFRKIITIIRLTIPYTGMILTARESPSIRNSLFPIGITQTDASSNIGLGGYGSRSLGQKPETQQFILGDTRTLDELIRYFANNGIITSFCTAGYRCGRTGKCIMDLLRSGVEGKFCKLNAVLTFREWLDDFASKETKEAGEKVIQKEIEEIKQKDSKIFEAFIKKYEEIKKGKRDLYF